MNTHPVASAALAMSRHNWPLKLLAVGLALALTAGVACKRAPATPTPSSPTTVPPTTAPSPQPTATPEPPPPETGFFLSITEPPLESVVRNRALTIKGTTTPDAVVSVNGNIVPVDANGAFSSSVTLEVGPNVIEVVASDFAGNQQSAILSAIYVPQ